MLECHPNGGCGADVEERDLEIYCSGTSASCEMGSYAIFVMVVPYCMIHFAMGNLAAVHYEVVTTTSDETT